MCETEALNLILHRALLPNCAALVAEHMAVGPSSRRVAQAFLEQLRGGPMPGPRVQTVKVALAALGYTTLDLSLGDLDELTAALERWLSGQQATNHREMAVQPSLFGNSSPVQASLFAA